MGIGDTVKFIGRKHYRITSLTVGKSYIIRKAWPDHDYIEVRNDKRIHYFYHKKNFELVKAETCAVTQVV